MNITITEYFDMNGDMTITQFLEYVNITPVSVVHVPGGNCGEGYDVTFKSFDDCLHFTRKYFGDYSDSEIYEVMEWTTPHNV
tara:strand:+ start:291 stop:536 length:246 start_codon:yes stop_codon:yes gene_type:complete